MAKKEKGILNKASWFDGLLYVLMGALAVITIFPFYYMVIVSFGTYEAINEQTIYLWPTVVDWSAYRMVFDSRNFFSSFGVTVFITIFGTALGVIFSVAAAYPLSKRSVPGSKAMFNMMLITMFFSGGLIPGYLVVQNLGLGDSVWCMIWPMLLVPFNIILIKNFFESMPAEIEESAKIDGANDMIILIKIVLPTAAPIIATMSLFYAVGKWNEYYYGMLHIIDAYKKPLQLVLREVLLDTAQTLSGAAAAIAAQEKPFYAITLQMAIVTIATIPILLVYPFVQKYFTKGIMIGAVKG